MRSLILFACFFLMDIDMSNAQVCNGSLGDPVLNETFGTKGYQLPANKTTYQLVGGCPNTMGTYTLSGFLFGCGPRSWVQMVGDHTPNDLEGNYMLLNAQNTPGTVYMDTLKNLCSNTTYQFGVWVTSVMTEFACDGNAVLPNVKFQISTLAGVILASDSTGYLPIVEERQWKFFGLSLKTPQNITDAILSITINPKFGCGSAFALDDITFRPCSPSLISATIDGTPGPADVCADYTNPFVMNAGYTPGFNDPVFQWQSSVDSGKTWVDISGETTLSYKVPHRTSGSILYRICIAEKGNINSVNCRITSNVISTSVHSLPDHSPPQNIFGCLGKNFFFPQADPKALQVLWTGPNSYNSTEPNSSIPDIKYNDTGLYKLKETFYFNCVSVDTFYLKVYPGTTISLQPSNAICEGQSEQLFASATDSVSYKWTPSEGLSSDIIANPVAKPTDSTNYKVVITNSYGCKDSAYAQIDVYRNPLANAGTDKFLLLGDTAVLNGDIKGTAVNFYWSPFVFMDDDHSVSPKVYPSGDTKYTLNVLSTVGCGAAADDVNVKVYNDIFIPNAFTPNDDGINDKFQILAFNNYRLNRLIIYNRWGQLVFETADSYSGWDGTSKGAPAPPGAYVYYLELGSPQGRKIARSGTILLLR